MRIADRIVLMRSGELIQVGVPEELYRAPVDLEVRVSSAISTRSPAGFRTARRRRRSAASRRRTLPTGRRRPVSARRLSGWRRRARAGGARIRSVRFLGEAHHVELDIQGLDEP